MPRQTVYLIVNRFIARGYSIDAMRIPDRRFNVISPAVQDFLTDPETLRRWAAFSLNERMVI